MLKLNFLPHRRRQRTERQQRFYCLLAAALGVGAASIGAGHIVLTQQLAQQGGLVQMLQTEHSRLDAQLRTAAMLQEKIADLAQQQQRLDAVRQQQNQATRLLQSLARQTPPGVLLRSVKQQAAQISLIGNAAAPEDVMLLLANLRSEDSPLRHAELQETHVAAARYDFSITADSAAAINADPFPQTGKGRP